MSLLWKSGSSYAFIVGHSIVLSPRFSNSSYQYRNTRWRGENDCTVVLNLCLLNCPEAQPSLILAKEDVEVLTLYRSASEAGMLASVEKWVASKMHLAMCACVASTRGSSLEKYLWISDVVTNSCKFWAVCSSVCFVFFKVFMCRWLQQSYL